MLRNPVQLNVGDDAVAILANYGYFAEFMHFLVYVPFTGLNSAMVSQN